MNITQVSSPVATPPIGSAKLPAPWELTKQKIKDWVPGCVLGATGVGAIITAVVVVGGVAALSAMAPWLPVALAVAFVALFVIAKYAPRLLTSNAQPLKTIDIPLSSQPKAALVSDKAEVTLDTAAPFTSTKRQPEITLSNFSSLMGIGAGRLPFAECQSILKYLETNKDQLVQKAQEAKTSIRTKAKDNNGELARTLLVTPEGKVFVILNQTNPETKGDIAVGEGGYKTVKYCFELTEEKLCTHATFTDKKAFDQETALLRNTLKGQSNILQILATDTFQSKEGMTKYSMITEYCNAGDLSQVLDNSLIHHDDKKEFCKAIAIALQKVHNAKYIHNDIKPANIFVKEENGKFIPILADFGGALQITDKNKQKTHGTLDYYHPRLAKARQDAKNKTKALKDLPSMKARDIWALGAVFYEIATPLHDRLAQGLPWIKNQATIEQDLAQLCNKKKVVFPKPESEKNLQYLAWNMLQVDEKKQWSLDQVIDFLEKNP